MSFDLIHAIALRARHTQSASNLLNFSQLTCMSNQKKYPFNHRITATHDFKANLVYFNFLTIKSKSRCCAFALIQDYYTTRNCTPKCIMKLFVLCIARRSASSADFDFMGWGTAKDDIAVNWHLRSATK